VRRPTLLGVFAIWAFLVSLAVYSWAGEKFAWLALHPLLPLILLAGIGIQAVWEARRRWYGIAGAVVTVLALAYSGYASFLVNAEHGADPREFLVSTQSSTDVKATAEQVLALARKRPGLQVTVDAADGATFPWAWYFRHLNVGYLDMSTGNPPPQTSDVVFLTDESRLKLQSHLIGYDGRRFRFRVWWVRDYKGALNPGDWARWFVHRTPWNPTGGMPEWVYVRRVVAASG
jgi:predicted membrane-bound mannosyltransferase